jgi:hypothetical protein
MAGPVSRLKSFIRDWFTRECASFDKPLASVKSTREGQSRRRSRTVAPSERFVWGIIAVIVALVGLIALEAVCIVVTGTFNSEVFSGISGIVTGLVTVFVMGKRGRRND